MAINPNTRLRLVQSDPADEANRFPRGVMGAVYRTAGNLTVTTTRQI
jgi:hypothetical protein